MWIWTTHLEEVGVPESGGEAEDVVPLGVLWDGLHDGAVDDDEVLGRGLHAAALARVARVEEKGRALKAHPVALPAALASKLDLDREINMSVYFGKVVFAPGYKRRKWLTSTCLAFS